MGPLLYLYVLSFLNLGNLDAIAIETRVWGYTFCIAGKLFNFPMIVLLIKSMENPTTIPFWALNSQTGD